jgi:Flp pilus assembly protein TadB
MTTNVIIGTGLGIGLGIGLWSLAVWLAPPRLALGHVIARTTMSRSSQSITTTSRPTTIARPAIAVLRAVGVPTPRLRRDLKALGRAVNDHLTTKVVAGSAGLLLPALGSVTLTLLGVDLGWHVTSALALAGAAIGFMIPDLRVRRAAEQRRTDFRHALSAYVDLVVISLAGGAGVDSALAQSATIGRGWTFTQLEHALATARLTRATPWSTLRQLGDDLHIPELAELAASASLAGTEGAKVRQSLAAKAASLRTRQLTDTEGQAASDTERMSLPIALLFLGFLGFVAYPATQTVLNGL